MTASPTFQSIILVLEHFWAEHGCLIWQPYYSQVGAGTMNPGTFLRVLGPEPWNVAYVEPSIRPDDGRYGENPNRFQQHYQYQVILKPDPGDPQELYMQSLEALGLDLRRHDLRFVEDNWEAPALGAWGLGWEVWLDGQEITQFTYFQQAGGLQCDPVSVELTYGLERILIALRNADAIWDEPWAGDITYGDVNLKGEYEHSKYYFEIADVERLRQMYALFDLECRAALAAGLVLPAYDYLLKCSHTFNVLDTRGAVGVTERAGFFGKMRGLAREVSEAYVAQRQQMQYPLFKEARAKTGTAGAKRTERLAPAQAPVAAGPQSFLLEIGVEELPAADLDAALAQLAESVPQQLDAARLTHSPIHLAGTPRRLIVYVETVAPTQADAEQVIKGPPANRAFDSDGNATPAAAGFARKKGVPVESLEVREMDGGRYAAAVVREKGRPAPQVLAERLPGLLAALNFGKSMRWNETNEAFSRPIRWFVALLGDAVIPFEYAGVQSGRTSLGLRRLGPPVIEITTASAYFNLMAAHHILVDPGQRRRVIAEQVAALAREVNGTAGDDPALLDEVTNLVESPKALRGSFDEAYLELPHDVLISVMTKHQRYFPVSQNGKLLPYFIAVRNGDDEGLDLVRQGNEHVVRARFADARFFVREDLKRPLEAFRAELASLTFQVKLGSMLDKAERIEQLAAVLAARLGLTEAETRTAVRAAHLCKADLATSMVVEMTSLQGAMGREYALRSGEPPEVAQATFEHYLPRGQNDALPESKAGIVVGLADRLDSLAGLFAAGLAPTGSADPFALRRAALGIVQILLGREISFSVREGLQAAAVVQPIPAAPQLEQAAEFVQGRLRAHLAEGGLRYDAVEAALAERGDDPLRARQAAVELERWMARPDWAQTLAAYARCVRITRDQAQTFPVSPAALVEPAEISLFAAYQQTAAKPRASVDDFLNALLPMIPTISQFFDDVLVMAEDRAVRENRLGLLQAIAALARGVADFSRLEGF